jgi:hypothetical protein
MAGILPRRICNQELTSCQPRKGHRNMQFVRFIQIDPEYRNANLHSEVFVNVQNIVNIEPVWYDVKDNKAWRAYVGTEDTRFSESPNAVRQHAIHDILGNVYYSSSATDDGKQLIEEMWKRSI